MSRRKWRWVTRSHDSTVVRIWQERTRPTLLTSGDYCATSAYVTACHEEFKALTGLTIPRGECRKVVFTKARLITKD